MYGVCSLVLNTVAYRSTYFQGHCSKITQSFWHDDSMISARCSPYNTFLVKNICQLIFRFVRSRASLRSRSVLPLPLHLPLDHTPKSNRCQSFLILLLLLKTFLLNIFRVPMSWYWNLWTLSPCVLQSNERCFSARLGYQALFIRPSHHSPKLRHSTVTSLGYKKSMDA